MSGAKNRRDYVAADVLGDEAEAGTGTRVPPVAPGMALSCAKQLAHMSVCMCVCVCVYIYIYIYVNI